MKPAERNLLEDARVLGRQLRPDLNLARQEVLARARQPQPPVSASRRHVVAGLVAGLALLLVAPGIGALTGPHGRGGAALPPETIGPAGLMSPGPVGGGAMIEPAVQLASAPVKSAGQSCEASALTLEIALDQAQFDARDPVGVTQVLRNRSASACTVPLDGCRSSITVRGPAGASVYASGADSTWVCAAAPGTVALAPGGIARITFTWRPGFCAGQGAACGRDVLDAGRYSVEATWAGLPSQVTPLPRHLTVGQPIQS